MSDKVSLRIGNREFSNFTSYSADSDFYLAADAWDVSAQGVIDGVATGQRAQLYVNGSLELDGMVDVLRSEVKKGDIPFKLAGRDLAGLLVDSHCPGYGDMVNVTLKALTEKLIAKVPFIQRSDVSYQYTKDTPEFTWQSIYVEPCRPIFEVLSEKAKACGLVFYSMPNGKFYFGRPRSTGKVNFHLTLRKDGVGNNCKYAGCIDDISKRYSEVNVISNAQGSDSLATSQFSVAATMKDPSFPKDAAGNVIYKPFYFIESTGALTPQKQAKMILNMQRRQGFGLVYHVPGHSQGGMNWSINELCSVDDEVQKKHGTYFVYGRKFICNKKEGAYTEVRLGLPELE